MNHQAPQDGFDTTAAGVVMAGTIFCAVVIGIGVGAFVAQPIAGALIGGGAGIGFGLWVVPNLLRNR